jgi:hypothetical protein
VIVHSDVSGVEESFGTADTGLRILTEGHPADFDCLGDGVEAFRNREMIRAGAELCCITVHRSLATSRAVRECSRQAIAAEVPAYLIEDE